MTSYTEDLATDSYAIDPVVPIIGDSFSGTLNNAGPGTDPLDIFNMSVVAGHTYLITSVSTSFAQLYWNGNDDLVFGTFGIDGPDREISFTAQSTGTFELWIGSDFSTSYTMDIVWIDAPIDPNAPTEGNDTIFGSGSDDSVFLLGGDDRYIAQAGNDTIDGGAGEDFLNGQAGNDYLIGGADDDKLKGGIHHDTLEGGTGRDNLSGNSGNDLLLGQDGNDVLIGGGGNDTMDGGNNNDRMFGGGGDDSMMAGNGNDKMQGQNGDDFLSGGLGKDLMRGGSGEDTLVGGGGDDTMRGGAGADVFVFEIGMNRDVISDFQDGLDLLDFSAMGIFDLSQLTLTQVGGHVRINASPSDFVTVRNVDLADLTSEDFIFDDFPVLG